MSENSVGKHTKYNNSSHFFPYNSVADLKKLKQSNDIMKHNLLATQTRNHFPNIKTNKSVEPFTKPFKTEENILNENFINTIKSKKKIDIDMNEMIKKSLVRFRNDSNTDNIIKKNESSSPDNSETSSNKDFLKQSLVGKKPKHFITSQNLFCPYCEHCNQKVKDNSLDQLIQSLNDTKSIIAKGFEYIIKSDVLRSENIHLFKENKIDFSKENEEIEQFVSSIPKLKTTSRLTYQTLVHYLNYLIEDQTFLETNYPDIIDVLKKESVFMSGKSFDNREQFLQMDKEIFELFDENFKRIIQYNLKKKYLKEESRKCSDWENPKLLEELNKKNRMKFSLLFMVFIQILSELWTECKERAMLIYKIFKNYFAEKDKQWILIINSMKDKIKYYKELCKLIIQQKSKFVDKIESINEVIFSHKLSEENLKNHKALINKLLSLNNEKRDEIYLLKSKIDILEKEIRFWIYDFDYLKINPHIRTRLKNIDIEKLITDLNDVNRHKGINKEEKALLINADRFLSISGQKSFYYDRIENMQKEIERLNSIYNKNYYKKKEWKNKYRELEERTNKQTSRIQKELNMYKSKYLNDYADKEIQTDIDLKGVDKLYKSYDFSKHLKRLNENKLSQYIEKVKYGYTKVKVWSKENLLYCIADIYQDKIDKDNEYSFIQLDEYCYNYFKTKLKVKKLVQENCEKLILSTFTYSNEDIRIEIFSKFIKIEKSLRKEVLDFYLNLLKTLPFSFLKLFTDEYFNFHISLETCFEIYSSKYPPYLNLIQHTYAQLIKECEITEDDKIMKYLTEKEKIEYYLLSRFFDKSPILISELLNDYKNENLNETKLSNLINNFLVANKEFPNQMNFDVKEIFFKHFKLSKNEEMINLQSFFEYFQKRRFFRVKIIKFIEISLSHMTLLSNFIENQLTRIFNIYENKNTELFTQEEFQNAVMSILGGNSREWKISEFFKKALYDKEKTFLTKEEFVIFGFHENIIIRSVLKDYVI